MVYPDTSVSQEEKISIQKLMAYAKPASVAASDILNTILNHNKSKSLHEMLDPFLLISLTYSGSKPGSIYFAFYYRDYLKILTLIKRLKLSHLTEDASNRDFPKLRCIFIAKNKRWLNLISGQTVNSLLARKNTVLFGRFLGYPECCSKRLKREKELHAGVLSPPERNAGLLLMAYMGVKTCRKNCRNAAAIGSDWLKSLDDMYGKAFTRNLLSLLSKSLKKWLRALKR